MREFERPNSPITGRAHADQPVCPIWGKTIAVEDPDLLSFKSTAATSAHIFSAPAI